MLRDFLETFDTAEKDGKVTPAEFIKYYSLISAAIDNDDYFELMMRYGWTDGFFLIHIFFWFEKGKQQNIRHVGYG